MPKIIIIIKFIKNYLRKKKIINISGSLLIIKF
jgi:hypothetical protein